MRCAAILGRENIRSLRERILVTKPNLENIDSYLNNYFIYFYSAVENYLSRKCDILKHCNNSSLNIKQNSYHIYTHGETAGFDVYPHWWIIPSILFPGTRVMGFLMGLAQFLVEVRKEQMPETQRIKALPIPFCSVKITTLLEYYSVLQITNIK